MEVRDPLEDALVVACPQSVEQERVRMQARMPPAPLVEVGRAVRLASRSAQHPVLSLVPLLPRSVDKIPRELVDEEQRRERGEMVEALVERLHVVQHATGDHGIPARNRGSVHSILERRPDEPLTPGRLWIDAERVVTL